MVFIEKSLEESSLFILFRTPDLNSGNPKPDLDPVDVDRSSSPQVVKRMVVPDPGFDHYPPVVVLRSFWTLGETFW